MLLAEDDSTMVSLLKTLLKMEGFEVLALDVNSDVPTVVRQEKPHALFMDVHLGGQSGMEILDTIRKQKELSDVRIVMTSGLNVREECINRGANAFLLKPFMPDDLIRALNNRSAPKVPGYREHTTAWQTVPGDAEDVLSDPCG